MKTLIRLLPIVVAFGAPALATTYGFREDFESYSPGMYSAGTLPSFTSSSSTTWDSTVRFNEADYGVTAEQHHWGGKALKIIYYREEDLATLNYWFSDHMAQDSYPTTFQATWWERYTGHWTKDVRCLKLLAINNRDLPDNSKFSWVSSMWPKYGGGMPRVMLNPFWTRWCEVGSDETEPGDWVFSDLAVDTWHKFHVEIELNTVGQSNGTTLLQVNDVTKLNLSNVRMRCDSNGFKTFWCGGNLSQMCEDCATAVRPYTTSSIGCDGAPCRLDPPLVRYIDDFWWSTDPNATPDWNPTPTPGTPTPTSTNTPANTPTSTATICTPVPTSTPWPSPHRVVVNWEAGGEPYLADDSPDQSVGWSVGSTYIAPRPTQGGEKSFQASHSENNSYSYFAYPFNVVPGHQYSVYAWMWTCNSTETMARLINGCDVCPLEWPTGGTSIPDIEAWDKYVINAGFTAASPLMCLLIANLGDMDLVWSVDDIIVTDLTLVGTPTPISTPSPTPITGAYSFMNHRLFPTADQAVVFAHKKLGECYQVWIDAEGDGWRVYWWMKIPAEIEE